MQTTTGNAEPLSEGMRSYECFNTY